MRTDLALWSSARVGSKPNQVIARYAAIKGMRSGILWGYVFGVTVASSALGYVTAYKTTAERANFALTFGSNAGLDAIAGPANQLQTVGGYTVWKSLAFLCVLGAIWGTLISTRLLRGEEESGRWELFVSGQTTPRRATGQVLLGLAAALATLFGVTSVITVVIGQFPSVHIPAGSMIFFSAALVSSAAVYLAAGALAAQLAATRRQAAWYAGTTLGVSYALRMVADSGTGLGWLRWATPLGWVEELEPLTKPHPLGFLPIVGLTALLAGVAVHLSGTRDLDASVLAERASARPHTQLLSGPLGLAVRLSRFLLAAWMLAIAAMAALLGFVAKQAGKAFSNTPSIERVFQKLGAHGAGALSYLGVSFLMLAVLFAFVGVALVSAARTEEASGRLDALLVRPVSRSSWLVSRLVVTFAAVIGGGVVAGLFEWLGAASEHAGVPFGRLLGAGLNVVPPAVFIVGLGVLALGVWPRVTSALMFAALVWSFLAELVGDLVGSNHWLLDTSVFHQMTAAPAVNPDWTSGSALVALGLAAALVGGIAFRARDLEGE